MTIFFVFLLLGLYIAIMGVNVISEGSWWTYWLRIWGRKYYCARCHEEMKKEEAHRFRMESLRRTMKGDIDESVRY